MAQARVIVLESGANFSSVPESFVTVLESRAPATTVRVPFCQGAHPIQLRNGQCITATHRTMPLRIRIHTAYGPVTLGHEVFTVMSGVDQEIRLGRGTLRSLGIDVDQHVNHYAEAKHRQSWACQNTCSFAASRSMRWHVPLGGDCPEATGDAARRSTRSLERDRVTDPAAKVLRRKSELDQGSMMDRERLDDALGR